MQLPKLELKVLGLALTLSVIHLGFIAYAALKLGISVPGCLPNDGSFNDPAFIEHDAKHYEVHFEARMWAFAPNYLELPVGSTLDVFLASKDVVHGLYIRGTNVNLMALPGAIANDSHVFTKPGIYEIICHEYCGANHQSMKAVIKVSDEIQKGSAAGLPEEALAQEATVDLSGEASAGKVLCEEKGCRACHSVDGTKVVGPSFKGLFGKKEMLDSGEEILVNEEYLHQSIKDPNSKVVKGYFKGTMPDLGLSDEDISKLVEYIKTVK